MSIIFRILFFNILLNVKCFRDLNDGLKKTTKAKTTYTSIEVTESNIFNSGVSQHLHYYQFSLDT